MDTDARAKLTEWDHDMPRDNRFHDPIKSEPTDDRALEVAREIARYFIEPDSQSRIEQYVPDVAALVRKAIEEATRIISKEYVPIGHVVGEGGKCWCGETHNHWCDSLQRLREAEKENAEMREALRHAHQRNHEHWPAACDGCAKVARMLAGGSR